MQNFISFPKTLFLNHSKSMILLNGLSLPSFISPQLGERSTPPEQENEDYRHRSKDPCLCHST